MLNYSQLRTLFFLSKCKHSTFFNMPKDMIFHISNFDYDPNPTFDPAKSDIAKLLHHIAYARTEDAIIIRSMLYRNPGLLLQASDVITPSGLKVMRVKPYELALGAGDARLAELVGRSFTHLPDGEKEKAEQYKQYRPAIEGILTQKPYDLTWLIEIIKRSSTEDVTAELEHKERDSELHRALSKFRKDFAPGVMIKPRMHFNYASLEHAFNMLKQEWDALARSNGNHYDKIYLFWRQVIGFQLRRLPSPDRCVFAQGLRYAPTHQVKRSYKLKEGEGHYPVTTSDDVPSGLGFDFACHKDGWMTGIAYLASPGDDVVWGEFMLKKHARFMKLMPPQYTMSKCTIS